MLASGPRTGTINISRLFSTLSVLRADEELAVARELLGIDAARVAVPLDEPGRVEHARARLFAGDLDEVWQESENVVLRDYADELAVLDDGQAPDPSRAHLPRSFLHVLMGRHGDHGRGHHLPDADRRGRTVRRDDLRDDVALREDADRGFAGDDEEAPHASFAHERGGLV